MEENESSFNTNSSTKSNIYCQYPTERTPYTLLHRLWSHPHAQMRGSGDFFAKEKYSLEGVIRNCANFKNTMSRIQNYA